VSAARFEEEVVMSNNGAQVLPKFPAPELFVANLPQKFY
jgi:Xaa-Pro dipeptidase